MQTITFITGNQKKAEYLEKYLWLKIEHIKLDLDEIQSLDLRKVVEHKARSAYEKVKKPILVDDVWLEFCALGRLPGTFAKFFEEEMSFETMCSLLDNKDRSAIARCGYGYYDGNDFQYFEWGMRWTIANKPAKDNWFWWDCIFIPEGYTITRAEMNEKDDRATYLKIKPIQQVRDFLLNH